VLDLGVNSNATLAEKTERKSNLLIKDAADEIGISTDAIRYYQKVGIISPHRGRNQYRYFDEDDLLILRYTLVLKYAGFSLAEIRSVLALSNSEQSQQDKHACSALLEKKATELRAMINNYSHIIALIDKGLAIADNSTTLLKEKTRLNQFVTSIYQDIRKQAIL